MRIASLQPSISVILQRLGQLEHLVACTKYCLECVPELREPNVRIISDSWSSDSTEILSCAPELVIAAVPYGRESVEEILKCGIRFLGLAPRTLADIYGDIALLAGILNCAPRGEAVIRQMQQEIEDVRIRSEPLNKPRVFVEEWGKPIICSQRWVAELVEAAGGIFVGKPGGQTDAEEVRTSDPDVIVSAWCGAGDRVPLERLVRKREWTDLRAVRQGRVFCVRDELLNTPAPNLVGGLRALFWALHPDRIGEPEGIRRIGDITEDLHYDDDDL